MVNPDDISTISVVFLVPGGEPQQGGQGLPGGEWWWWRQQRGPADPEQRGPADPAAGVLCGHSRPHDASGHQRFRYRYQKTIGIILLVKL